MRHLTETMYAVLDGMMSGEAWESENGQIFAPFRDHEGKMHVDPRTMYSLQMQGCVENHDSMFRRRWRITRLGEIELFDHDERMKKRCLGTSSTRTTDPDTSRGAKVIAISRNR